MITFQAGLLFDNPPAPLDEDFLDLFDSDECRAIIDAHYMEWEESRERAGRKLALAARLNWRVRGCSL